MSERRKQQRAFAAEIVALKARAGQLELWRTMHALEVAVTAVGYELADIIEGKQHVSQR